MDYIRNCHVYKGTKCNCPEGSCRREQSELEALESENNVRAARQRLADDLVEFQVYLKNEGFITGTDWTFEDEANNFLNQR